MKRLLMALLVAITSLIAFTSCDWFSLKQANSDNPLLGKWKVDSINAPVDSSGFGYLLLAMSLNDSAAYDYEFSEDSLTFISKSNNIPQQSIYSFDHTRNEVIIKNDPDEVYRFSKVNDSLVALQARDSSTIFLKRK